MDEWISGHYQSIQNFILLISSHKEYVKYIIGLQTANIKKAREIINQKYPRIENVRCCINLIARDMTTKEKFVK